MSPVDIYNETVRLITQPQTTFIRFTGGEPTLYWSDISEFLDMFQRVNDEKRVPILIQTNGIEIGKGNVNLDILGGNSAQKFLFELSIKGTNSSEFEILTTKPQDLYKHQVAGYYALKNISNQFPNVQVVAVLGVYHSSVSGPSKYAFVNPQNNRLLFESYESWDDGFKEIWEGTTLKWVEPLRMSPKGVWNNIVKRCGENGAGILKRFPLGADTNSNRLFPPKPKSFDYARYITTKKYWTT